MRKCPKCSGTVLWLEQDDGGLYNIRCQCGLCLPVTEDVDGGMTVQRRLESKLMLPATGSKLSRSLKMLRDVEIATSKELADRLSQTVVYTSTQLCTLENRGLVYRLTNRKGTKGGSTWTLTDIALEALGE